MGRLIQLGLLAAGAVLLVVVVHAIGLGELARDLHRLGWGFLGVVAIELLIDGCNTLGWRSTIDAPVPLPFWHLYWVRQAGTAVNQLTPTATLGGELVKAMLLRPRLATVDAVASLIATRMTFATAQAALCAAGLVVAVRRLEHTPELAAAIVVAALLLAAGVATFILLQRRGVFAALARHGDRLGMQPRLLARLYAGAGGLDERLGHFYRNRTLALAASIGWHLAAQVLSVVQLVFILQQLGVPASVTTCLAIEACALVIDAALFFVPAHLGVQEGGRVLVFTALGFSAATGLSVAIVVRLNQLAVSAIGLAAFAYFSLTRSATEAAPVEARSDAMSRGGAVTSAPPTRTA